MNLRLAAPISVALAVLAGGTEAQGTVYESLDLQRAGGVAPEWLGCGGPEYPSELARAGVVGEVSVVYVVGSDGWVDPATIDIEESAHPDLTRSIQVWLLNCKFSPGRLSDDGDSVAVRMRARHSFGHGSSRQRGSASTDRPSATVPPLDPRGIHLETDTANGRPSLTEFPSLIACPRYDPQSRPNRSRVASRYEREQELERMPENVEALLELVIGIDGIPESELSKMIRTTDSRLNDTLLQWARSCRFEPGKIGDRAVRVRIEFPVKFSFVRE